MARRSPLHRVPARAALVIAGLALLACGGKAFDGRVVRSDDVRFRLGEVPAGWHEGEIDGALVAFRDDGARAMTLVNGRCGKDADDVPLRALTQHLFLYFTGRTPPSEHERTVRLDGREALRSELEADLDGVRRHFVTYVLKKDGCVYDFVLVTPGASSPAVPAFDRFVGGFGTL